ncbi:MAG: DUF6429 family protein [Chloroflexi bacterium]|nr:DUF6429 family protein [Chloroflexota bacterium]MCL5275226.1 DUF6429 family protein [Chloroflexota bacterium]
MSSLEIDWAGLSHAFESGTHNTRFYLDCDTGTVVRLDDDTLVNSQRASKSVAEAAGIVDSSEYSPIPAASHGRYAPIPQTDSVDEYRDIEAYIATIADRTLQSELRRAIRGRGAFKRFGDTLANHPGERRNWLTFRQIRMLHRMNDWLAEYDIQPANRLQPPVLVSMESETQSNPTAERQELIEELTLLLVYLSSWEEQTGPSAGARKAWKGYTYMTLNSLEDRGLIHQSRKARSVTLTEEGIALARELEMRFIP